MVHCQPSNVLVGAGGKVQLCRSSCLNHVKRHMDLDLDPSRCWFFTRENWPGKLWCGVLFLFYVCTCFEARKRTPSADRCPSQESNLVMHLQFGTVTVEVDLVLSLRHTTKNT